jgi:6-phospho-3-hexuloisomerase
MPVKNTMLTIVRHVESIVESLDEKEIEDMVKVIEKADGIFLMGTGRSGLVAKAFATRLVQLGLTAYVVGESVTPAMTYKDLLIAVSGSGETNSVVRAAEISKKVGAKVLTVTSYPHSSVGKLSDYTVTVKGRTKIDIEKDPIRSQIEGSHSSLTPLGTLFEDTVMIFFDGIIAKLMIEMKAGEEDLKRRHAIVE